MDRFVGGNTSSPTERRGCKGIAMQKAFSKCDGIALIKLFDYANVRGRNFPEI